MEEYLAWWNYPFHFLFESWDVNTKTALFFTVLASFSVAVAFEGLRVVGSVLHKVFHTLPLVVNPSSTFSIYVTDSLDYVRSQRVKNHLLQTAIHVVKVVLSYGLMLAVMTYNAFIVTAIVVGGAIGYFVFCHKIAEVPERALSRTTICSSLDSPDQSQEEGKLIA